MEQAINDFINTICDLKKEPKKRPIGFVTENEDDPFFDSSINRLLKRLGHDQERGMTISHDVLWYLESLLKQDELRYPRRRLQCSNCKTFYVFHIVPTIRQAPRVEDDYHNIESAIHITHKIVNCVICDSRMMLQAVESIIKFEAVLSSQNPTREEPTTFDFNNIGEPLNL